MKSLAALMLVGVAAAPMAARPLLNSETPKNVVNASATLCVDVPVATDRLACYDRMIAKTKTPITGESVGDWRINATLSSRDGSARVLIRVPNIEPIKHTEVANGSPDLFFYAACRSGRTTVWINYHSLLKNKADEVAVSFSVDGQTSRLIAMRSSHDTRSLGLWNDSAARRFLSEISSGENLLVHAKPPKGAPFRARFNIAKMQRALKPLAQACEWKQAQQS